MDERLCCLPLLCKLYNFALGFQNFGGALIQLRAAGDLPALSATKRIGLGRTRRSMVKGDCKVTIRGEERREARVCQNIMQITFVFSRPNRPITYQKILLDRSISKSEIKFSYALGFFGNNFFSFLL